MSFSFEGCELSYDDQGSGPAVVLLHGAGMDRTMWEPQAQFLLERGHRVVAWDARLHGRSRPSARPVTARQLVDDLVALIRHLGLEAPILIGQSMGGNLAQAVVRAHPDIASALVVIDSTWNTGPLSRFERWALGLAAPAISLVPAGTLPGMMAKASAASDAVVAETTEVFARMPKRDFIEVWRATTEFVAPDPQYRTPVPLLLIRGALDRTGNIRTAMPAWAAVERVAEHVVPEAGHLANLDAPDAVNELIGGFLRAVRT